MPEPHDWETDPRSFAECLRAHRSAHGFDREAHAAELRIEAFSTYKGWTVGRPCPQERAFRRLMTLIDRDLARA